jgi:hypothetical protein
MKYTKRRLNDSMYSPSHLEVEAGVRGAPGEDVHLGLGRIVAPYYRSSTPYQIRYEILHLIC